MACPQLQGPQQECGCVVVRRARVEVVSDPNSTVDKDFILNPSLRCRAQSDTALYEKGSSLLESPLFGAMADPQQIVEFELLGLSDGESNDGEAENHCPCSIDEVADHDGSDSRDAYFQKDQPFKVAESAAKGGVPANWSEVVTGVDSDGDRLALPAGASDHFDWERAGCTPAHCASDIGLAMGGQTATLEEPGGGGAMQDVDMLWKESLRLPLENELSWQNARLADESPTLKASPPACALGEHDSGIGLKQDPPKLPPGMWLNASTGAGMGVQYERGGMADMPCWWRVPVEPAEPRKEEAASTRRRRRHKHIEAVDPTPQGAASSGEASAEEGEERRAIMMLRNWHNDYSCKMLLDMPDAGGSRACTTSCITCPSTSRRKLASGTRL